MTASALATALLSTALLAGCAYPSKRAYSSRMAELCSIDGGVTVLKKVSLPAEFFDSHGDVKYDPGSKELSVAGRYAIEWEVKKLAGAPEHALSLEKLTQTIRDTHTGEVLGRLVAYYRKGGNTVSPNNASDYCPKNPAPFVGAVFVRSVQ